MNKDDSTKKQNASAPTANTNLRLDWCSHAAAKFAVEHWHYSKRIPEGKCVKIGVWENGKFIGVVLFGTGSNNNAGNPYGLSCIELCELTRVALTAHKTPVSRILAIACKMVTQFCTGLKLIVSYADPTENHHGGIYQACGWHYVGSSRPQREIRVGGVFMHKRSAYSKFGTASPEKIKKLIGENSPVEYSEVKWKHTYILPLDAEMKAQIEPLRKPYPKRAGSADSGTSANHAEGGGAIPTSALQIDTE